MSNKSEYVQFTRRKTACYRVAFTRALQVTQRQKEGVNVPGVVRFRRQALPTFSGENFSRCVFFRDSFMFRRGKEEIT